jgi:hypothetical protein
MKADEQGSGWLLGPSAFLLGQIRIYGETERSAALCGLYKGKSRLRNSAIPAAKVTNPITINTDHAVTTPD